MFERQDRPHEEEQVPFFLKINTASGNMLTTDVLLAFMDYLAYAFDEDEYPLTTYLDI